MKNNINKLSELDIPNNNINIEIDMNITNNPNIENNVSNLNKIIHKIQKII